MFAGAESALTPNLLAPLTAETIVEAVAEVPDEWLSAAQFTRETIAHRVCSRLGR